VAYPVGDLLLIFALLIISYYSRKSLFWIDVALAIFSLAMIVTDSNLVRDLMGTYSGISGAVLDSTFLFSYMLIALLVFIKRSLHKHTKKALLYQIRILLFNERISLAWDYMPYVWVGGASFVQNYRQLGVPDKIPNVLVISVGCIDCFVYYSAIIYAD